MEIRPCAATDAAMRQLLNEHLVHMADISREGSMRALDVDGLAARDVTMWAAWNGDALLGCGALKALDTRRGEIKSMRTRDAYRGPGVATRIPVTTAPAVGCGHIRLFRCDRPRRCRRGTLAASPGPTCHAAVACGRAVFPLAPVRSRSIGIDAVWRGGGQRAAQPVPRTFFARRSRPDRDRLDNPMFGVDRLAVRPHFAFTSG